MTKALVLITEGSEELESVAVIDILRRAGIKVDLVSITNSEVVSCANGVRILADKLFSTIEDPLNYDALVLPGGSKAAQTYSENEAVQHLLRAYEKADKLVAAICASTIALKSAGVYKGRSVTSYPSFKDQLKDFYVYSEDRVVTDGKLITSRGPGSALEFALQVVGQIVGHKAADAVANGVLFKS